MFGSHNSSNTFEAVERVNNLTIEILQSLNKIQHNLVIEVIIVSRVVIIIIIEWIVIIILYNIIVIIYLFYIMVFWYYNM